jgi:formamidopyrimidine-DNA glycosylase
MPELPEMQALSERLETVLRDRTLSAVQLLGFSSLKTVIPAPDNLVGERVVSVGRRGKYVVVAFEAGQRLLIHLSQAGRMDLEQPPKTTKPKGALVWLSFGDLALLVREHGTQRKAGWWVLGPGDDGPLATLGPEPDDARFEQLLLHDDSSRHLHTMLRDQHVVAGIGRGYADDTLNRAQLSPFGTLASLGAADRERLLSAVRSTLAEALERERTRTGALSEPRLGERFAVHNRRDQPCPMCGSELKSVRFDSYEIVYCPACQTKGRVLADRRLSRLLR